MAKNRIEGQTDFVEALFINFMLSMKEHLKNERENPGCMNHNYMNKNCGKYALKRKITMIRQELLNLEKMLEV